MNMRPIRCETDDGAAIDSLMGAAPDTPEGDWLDVLVTLVEACEARRWPVEAPDPVALTEHAMEARGYRNISIKPLTGKLLAFSRYPWRSRQGPATMHRFSLSSGRFQIAARSIRKSA